MKIRALTVFFVTIALLSTAYAQPAQQAVDAVADVYYGVVSISHRIYELGMELLSGLMRLVLLPRTLVEEFFGFTLMYAIVKVTTVLVEDIFVVLGLFMRGFGAITSLCLSCPLCLMAAINFLLSNVIYLFSVFLVSVSSFMPGILSAYVHDFVFNFMEGFSDPWPTCIAVWPEIEYYMDIIEPLTGLSGMMQNTTQSLGALGSLLTLPLSTIVNCAGGVLNAIMYTKIGTQLCA